MENTTAPQGSVRNSLNDDHLRAIGVVVAQWAISEHYIQWGLATLAYGRPIRTSRQAGGLRLLVNRMDARLMLSYAKAIGRARFRKDVAEWDRLIDGLNEDRDKRDLVAHGLWRQGQRPNSIRTVSFRSVVKLSVKLHDYTPAELEAVAERARARLVSFCAFMARHGLSLSPPPEKRPRKKARKKTAKKKPQRRQ